MRKLFAVVAFLILISVIAISFTNLPSQNYDEVETENLTSPIEPKNQSNINTSQQIGNEEETESIPEPQPNPEPKKETEIDEEKNFSLEISSSDYCYGAAWVQRDKEMLFFNKFEGVFGESTSFEYELRAKIGDVINLEIYPEERVSVRFAKTGFFSDKTIFRKLFAVNQEWFKYTIVAEDIAD